MESFNSLALKLRRIINEENFDELDDFNVEPKPLEKVSMRALEAEQFCLSQVAAAARNLGLGMLEKTALSGISNIAVLAKRFHNKTLQPLLVSAEDIGETSLA